MMPRMRFDRLLLAVLAAAAPGGAAFAWQITLPPHSGPRGDLAPHVVCSVCGERNYNAPTNARRDENGDPIAWCVHCRRDTLHRGQRASGDLSLARPGSNSRLRLPPPRPVHAAPTTDAAGQGTMPRPAPLAPIKADGAAEVAREPAREGDAERAPGAGAASFIFTQVRKTTSVDDRLALQAVDSLAALGAPGLAAARIEIDADEAPVLVTAARVLLRAGSAEDIELVKSRARRKLPAAAGAALVEALAGADPVHVPPRTFAELLESNHSGVRLAAEKTLRGHLGPELLPLLEPALVAKRGDTRFAALGLVADIADPEGPERGTTILLEHIADPLAKVANHVVGSLAGREDPELDARLVALAFRQRWILRESAYALLALVEREDLAVRPILDSSAVEPLLAGMQSSDPFVGGSCAAALAGIGFRSAHTKATGWLDRDVVDRLVHAISGQTFHNDFSALAVPALRRLRLVTGQEFGNDGPRWIEWWLAARPTFYARRACLEVAPEDVTRVRLHLAVPGEEHGTFTLLGPEAGAPADPYGVAGETFYLTAAEARDLLVACEREGALGPERLPGRRGSPGSHAPHTKGERALDIAIAERGKSFVFAPGASEPWFERMVGAALALRDRNRWQRFPRAGEHASPYALWLEQSEWWSQEPSDRERALRLKSLVLGALPLAHGTGRDQGLAELERLYADPTLCEAADFPALLGLIQSETTYSERVRKLHRLALRAAASAAAGADAAGTDVEGGTDRAGREVSAAHAAVPGELGLALALALIERFGAAATEELARTVAACGSAVARSLADDPHPELRAVTAQTLAADPTEVNVAALTKLLHDPVQQVEVAAVEALGERRVEAARTELLVRARLGLPAVRVAALQAIGRLGGEYALDALVLGLADSDPTIHVAAARGLGELADPASTQLLISLLSEGRGAPVYAPARAGLLGLGEAAWPDLLRVVHAPAHRARREVALLLAEQCVPEATSALITLLTASPNDAYIASELAVLTGLDLRSEPDPAGAWWNWWDGVVHDDALAWFRAALERASVATPARSAFDAAGTAEGREFLIEVMARPEPHLVERARRELSRMLGRDLGALPPKGAARDAWLADLRSTLVATREQ